MHGLTVGNATLLLAVLATIMLTMLIGEVTGCPSTCECRWKKGKQTVECTDKGLMTIPVNINSGTQVLTLSGNNIRIIPVEKFRRLKLTNLQRIHMSRCKTTTIDDRAFAGLTNLVELDLSENLLIAVPSRTFQDIPSLMQLSLSGNPIRHINHNSFESIQQLKTLDLSHCHLEIVEDGAFATLTRLQWLKLSGNQLKSLSSEGLSRSMHGVELQKNPWSCDCQLRGLRRWLLLYKFPPAVAPLCSQPPHLFGQPVREAPEQQLACPPHISPDSVFLEVPEGENISMVCRTRAEPQANVSWSFNGQKLERSGGPYSINEFSQDAGKSRHSELVIHNSSLVDQGIFRCHAANQAGEVTANFNLRVLLPPDSSSSETAPPESSNPYFLVIGISLAVVIVLMTVIMFIVVFRCASRRRTRRSDKPNGSKTSVRDLDTLSTSCSMPKNIQMGTSSMRSSISQSTAYTDSRDGVSFISQHLVASPSRHASVKHPDVISVFGDTARRQSHPSEQSGVRFQETEDTSCRFNQRCIHDNMSSFTHADVHDNFPVEFGLPRNSSLIGRSRSHHHQLTPQKLSHPGQYHSLPRRPRHSSRCFSNPQYTPDQHPHFSHVLPEHRRDDMQPILQRLREATGSSPPSQEHDDIRPILQRLGGAEGMCTLPRLQTSSSLRRRGPAPPQRTCSRRPALGLPGGLLHPTDAVVSPADVNVSDLSPADLSRAPQVESPPQLAPPVGFTDDPPTPTCVQHRPHGRGDPNQSGLPLAMMAETNAANTLVNKLSARVLSVHTSLHESPDEGYDETAADTTDV